MSHAAVAVIKASALRNNLNTIKRKAVNCRVMAVVKANAYGHGLVPVAEILAAAGVDAFGVARIEEGVALREAGISQTIVALEGCVNSEEAIEAVRHRLDVVLHESSQFAILEGLPEDQRPVLWLKLDTGMGRLGFPPEKLPYCLDRIADKQLASARPALMTHFACADAPNDPATTDQMRYFGKAMGDYAGDVSMANSAAIFVWPKSLASTNLCSYAGRNWVRPGIALYGGSPLPGVAARELNLEAAMSFESRLISVKTLRSGDRVGYGGGWVARRDTILGVVAAGYGDGYPRCLETGTPVLVNGHRARLVGRVSMDMLTVDLSDVPVARVGDKVVLWGANLPVEEIAARAKTISYELMCGLSQRVAYRYED
ncbi:MAG: alanine racemase [Gammaproteobacteria bacterium]